MPLTLRASLAVLASLAASSAFAAHVAFGAADTERGRGLYELRCGECHAESVHGRTHRVARNIPEIRLWVQRWSDNLKLGWGTQEVNDVAAYLNAAYYRFECEAPECRAVSLAPAAGQ